MTRDWLIRDVDRTIFRELVSDPRVRLTSSWAAIRQGLMAIRLLDHFFADRWTVQDNHHFAMLLGLLNDAASYVEGADVARELQPVEDVNREPVSHGGRSAGNYWELARVLIRDWRFMLARMQNPDTKLDTPADAEVLGLVAGLGDEVCAAKPMIEFDWLEAAMRKEIHRAGLREDGSRDESSMSCERNTGTVKIRSATDRNPREMKPRSRTTIKIISCFRTGKTDRQGIADAANCSPNYVSQVMHRYPDRCRPPECGDGLDEQKRDTA